MKEIKLQNDKGIALVDDEDYELLVRYKWHLDHGNYAKAHICRYNGKPVHMSMHRLILGVTKFKDKVDHIDHNGLNNQKSNLRICTQSQNAMNRRKGFGTSKYIGVCLHKLSGLYSASVYVNKKYKHLGYFKNEIDAAIERDKWAKECYGEFAKLNFP